jgi:hypothetical protein
MQIEKHKQSAAMIMSLEHAFLIALSIHQEKKDSYVQFSIAKELMLISIDLPKETWSEVFQKISSLIQTIEDKNCELIFLSYEILPDGRMSYVFNDAKHNTTVGRVLFLEPKMTSIYKKASPCTLKKRKVS